MTKEQTIAALNAGEVESREILPEPARPMFDLMVKHYVEAKRGWRGPYDRHDHTKAGIDRRVFAANALAEALRKSFGGTLQEWSQSGLRAAYLEMEGAKSHD